MTRDPAKQHNQAPGRERVCSALDPTAPTGGRPPRPTFGEFERAVVKHVARQFGLPGPLPGRASR